MFVMYDIIVFDVRPHVNEKPAFSKLFTLESVYKKMLFWRPFTRVDGRPNRRKNFRFKQRRFLVPRDQVFPLLSLSTGYQILTKKLSRFRPFSSIRIRPFLSDD